MGKQRQNKKRRQHLNPPAWVGIGLLILGVASLIFLTNNKSTSAAASELSVTPMEVNFPAPQLALQNLQGETQSLEDFRGDVVLVNNWATWCPPCKAEMPSLKKFHDTHADAGFTVIAVDAGEGLDDVLAFAKGYELTFLVWLDPKQESLTVIRNGSLPNSYVIDRTGTVRLAWTGEISLTVLEKYVTPIIEENN